MNHMLSPVYRVDDDIRAMVSMFIKLRTVWRPTLGSAPAYLYAAPSDEDSMSNSATLSCTGASKVETDGTVTKSSGWVFSN